MLNKDYANGIQNVVRNSMSLDFSPVPNKWAQLPQIVSNGINEWDNMQKSKAYVDALKSGDQEQINQAWANYDPQAYANYMNQQAQRAEERQWYLDDLAAQRDFQRDLLRDKLNNEFALAKYKAGLDAQNAGGEKPFDAKATTDLRKEFRTNSKEYFQIGDQYGKMREAAASPSAAGDVAMIFSFMKMLDPSSVVREGEYANAQNAAGVPTRIVAAYNRAIDGTRLTDEQRSDFLNQGKKFYDTQKKRFTTEADWYKKIAQSTNANPDFVVQDPYDFSEQNDPLNFR